jgi:hypothetical protein
MEKMNFIYRIYEVCIDVDPSDLTTKRNDIILNQEVMIAESRESFKENIKLLYPNVKFANNSKLKNGDIYCIIISDSCYNIEEYLDIKEYECSHCHNMFKTNEKHLYKYRWAYLFRSNRVDSKVLKDYEDDIKSMCFCSKRCKLDHILDITDMLEKETLDMHQGDKDFPPDTFITKETFMNIDNISRGGYIYKISKKSTEEFYVGQTIYVPIFRWGQHLLTERFNIQNIDDYVFEILEVVKNKKLLNQREAYWIKKCREEKPDLSLNIIIPKENKNESS